MKKILLIGELNENTKSVNEYLSETYQVQLCTKEQDDIQAMVKIIHPELIILYQLGLSETESAILKWLSEKYDTFPILAITTTEEWKLHKNSLQGEQHDKIFQPLSKDSLLQKCRQMLLTGNSQNTKKNSRGMKKILVVDDSPLILRNIKGLLERKYDIFLATSGRQALDTIIKEEPDLILLDYEMPEMSGKEVFEEMQADEDMKDIPVIFLTSISDKKVIYSILQLKPVGYILKPPDTEKLLETIQEVFRK